MRVYIGVCSRLDPIMDIMSAFVPHLLCSQHKSNRICQRLLIISFLPTREKFYDGSSLAYKKCYLP
jgi:hypothetical protein